MSDKIIRINNRLYDEYGQLLKDQSGAISAPLKMNRIFSDITGGRPATSNKPIIKKPVKKSHQVASHQKRKVQKSNTLIRSVLKKPDFSGEGTKIHASSSSLSREGRSNQSLALANSTQKSKYIKKFKTINYKSSQSSSTYNVPVNIHQPTIQANIIPKISIQQTEPKKRYNPFDDAVERAIPNKQQATKKVVKENKSGLFSTTNVIAYLFIIVGTVIVFMSYPKLNTSVVSTRSGVNIILPKTIPAGYKIDNNIIYTKGTAFIYYNNQTSTFAIKEQNNPLALASPLTTIANEASSTRTIYTWTKNKVTFFLYSDNLSQYQINNIYSST